MSGSVVTSAASQGFLHAVTEAASSGLQESEAASQAAMLKGVQSGSEEAAADPQTAADSGGSSAQ